MRPRKYKNQSGLAITNKYKYFKYTKIDTPAIDDTINNQDTISISYIRTPEGLKRKKEQSYISDLVLADERYRFNLSNDPNTAFSIFIKCVENGYYPPKEVLDYLSNNFKVYINSDDSLDSVMALTKRAKKAYKNIDRNTSIVIEIDILRFQLGIDIEDAIYAVVERYAESEAELGEHSIRDIYYREGKKQIESGLMELHSQIYDIEDFDDDDRLTFMEDILLQYPEDVIRYLKKKYSNIKPLLKQPIEKLESSTNNK